MPSTIPERPSSFPVPTLLFCKRRPERGCNAGPTSGTWRPSLSAKSSAMKKWWNRNGAGNSGRCCSTGRTGGTWKSPWISMKVSSGLLPATCVMAASPWSTLRGIMTPGWWNYAKSLSAVLSLCLSIMKPRQIRLSWNWPGWTPGNLPTREFSREPV